MRYTVLSFLITASLLTSCNIANSEHEATAKHVDFTTLLEHFSTDIPVHELQTVILDSTSDAEIFLSQFPSDDINIDQLISVTYSDSLVIGVFSGSKPNTSYSVSIDSVVVSAQSSLVYSTETGSAEGFDAVSWPAHFIVVSNADFNPRTAGFQHKRICLMEPCGWPAHTATKRSSN